MMMMKKKEEEEKRERLGGEGGRGDGEGGKEEEEEEAKFDVPKVKGSKVHSLTYWKGQRHMPGQNTCQHKMCSLYENVWKISSNPEWWKKLKGHVGRCWKRVKGHGTNGLYETCSKRTFGKTFNSWENHSILSWFYYKGLPFAFDHYW
jgi:hypothetical protein